MENSHTIVTAGIPWELRGRGRRDSDRHDIRVKDAIKKNLREIIGEEAIISSDGVKRIRFPLKYLDQYRFKYGNVQPGVGQGEGKEGDVLVAPGLPGIAGDHEAGDQPGAHHYDVEVDVDTLVHMMLEDLGLPWLEAKDAVRQVIAEDYQFTDIRKRGPLAHLDKRRTLRENLLRNAAKGTPRIGDLRDDDLRFRVWDVNYEHDTQAAVYLLMDCSGSMTTDKKYIARAFFFWMCHFLKHKYPHVETVFIHHDTEAEIVDEADFFTRTTGGGTRCSSAYKVAYAHMQQHYPLARWNVYLFHFSDGDNLPDDNDACKKLVEQLLTHCQQIGYGEVPWTGSVPAPSSLLKTLNMITHSHFMTTVLTKKADVLAALQRFLQAQTIAT